MRKKILLWLPFQTVSLFLLQSCMQELYTAEEAVAASKTKIEWISKRQVEQNKLLYARLRSLSPENQKTNGDKTEKIYTDLQNGFSIDTSRGLLIENENGKKTYTFKIDRYKKDVLENLVLTETASELYDACIVTYDSLLFRNTEKLNDSQVKQYITLDFLGKKSSSDVFSKIITCYDSRQIPVYIPGTTCTSSEHHQFGDPACQLTGYNAATAGYWTTSYVFVMYSCDDGMPDYGGGSTVPIGGSGGWNGNPISESLDPNSPCYKLREKNQTITFKNNITSLAGRTGESSERGYRMDYKGQTFANPLGTGTNNQFLQNAPKSTVIDYRYFLPATYAIIHTHYDTMNDPIFSPGDILQFNEWLVNAKAWNDNPANTIKIDLTKLTYTLVTSWGNYTLIFDGIDVVPLTNYNTNDLISKYEKAVTAAMNVANVSGSVNFNMTKLEEEFLKFVKENLNIPGMKLFKIENNGNTEIFLTENNKRDTKKCN